MLEAFGLSDTGCVRSNNEDYFLIEPKHGLYVVADGMGGASAGERASHLAAQAALEVVQKAGRRDSQVLLEAMEEANRRVMEAAKQDPELEGMGTTLVAALDAGDQVLIASVGDSRAYLLDQEALRAVTEDQTWVHDVGEPLGLDEESLRQHPMRHVLTMAIGLGAPLAVNYYEVRMNPAAQLLLSSDGLHGVVPAEVIAEILREPDRLEKKCRSLIEAAREAGGPDNITVVLLRAC